MESNLKCSEYRLFLTRNQCLYLLKKFKLCVPPLGMKIVIDLRHLFLPCLLFCDFLLYYICTVSKLLALDTGPLVAFSSTFKSFFKIIL
jgi:hypothetical protein